MATYGTFAQKQLSASRGVPLAAAEPVVFAALQARLDELLADVKPVQLLDAGCGKHRPIPIADDCHIVGVDISERQLEDNPAIDEAIVGDIQTCQLGRSRFDAIVCWYVLEHLENPEQALLNFKSALKPRGVIVLAVPHASSIKGLVTRFTPFWFHGWVWRHLLSRQPGVEPFPTFMSLSITPQRLCAFAKDHGLSVEFLSEYEGWEQKKLRSRLRLTGRAFWLLQLLVRCLSFGKITFGVTDAVVVLQS